MLKGFDFSHYQQDIDFAKAYAAGYRFAIGKAAQGLKADPTFPDRAKAARDAGLVVGGYEFIDPTVKPEDALDFFLNRFPKGLPFLFAGDFEECSDGNGGDKWDLLDGELRSTVAQDFLDGLGVATKAKGILYGAPYFLNKYLGDFPTGSYRIWLADYAKNIPVGWRNVTVIWQDTDGEQVDGIPGPVDGDVYNGAVEDLAALCGVLR